MNDLAQWVKKIAIFYIIGAMVLNLVPNENYKKYIKIFTGFVLIVLLLEPLGRITSKNTDFTSSFFENTNLSDRNELNEKIRLADEKRYEILVNEYTEPIKKNIADCVENQGGNYIDSVIEIDTDMDSDTFGNIMAVTVNLKRVEPKTDPFAEVVSPKEELMVIEIKNYISDFYNVDKRNIYVNIS